MMCLVNFIGVDRWVFRAAGAALLVVCVASPSAAAEEATLQARTAADFAKYVAAVEARSAQSIQNNEPFLILDRKPAADRARIMAMLSRGEVYVERAQAPRENGDELDVDGGSVQHWLGTVLVPHVTLDELLKVLQEPQTDKHKQEDVLASRVINRDGDKQQVYLRLRRTKFVTVVYDTEYDVEYKRLDKERAYSNSISTKIVEVENAGTPKERTLPEGNDHGYMWRLNSYWRWRAGAGRIAHAEPRPARHHRSADPPHRHRYCKGDNGAVACVGPGEVRTLT
jgi:hypothetical protein